MEVGRDREDEAWRDGGNGPQIEEMAHKGRRVQGISGHVKEAPK